MEAAALGEVPANLRNDHIGFVHRNSVSDAQLQIFHYIDIVHRCPANRGSLQLHRIKNCHRIQQSRAGRTPLDFPKHRFRLLITPFKGHGILRELRCGSQGSGICQILQGQNQSVRRNLKGGNPRFKFIDSRQKILSVHLPVFHHVEPLLRHPFHLGFPAVLEVHLRRLTQGKGVEVHVSLRRNPAVQLAHTAAAQVPRVLVFRIRIVDGRVDFLKILVANHRFSSYHRMSPMGNGAGHVPEYPGVRGNHLAHIAVSAGHRLGQLSFFIGQHHRQTIQLPGQQRLPVAQPGTQRLPILGFIQTQHPPSVTLLRQFRLHRITHVLGRTVLGNVSALRLQPQQFVVQLIVFVIGHDLAGVVIIGPGGLVQLRRQLVDSLSDIFH